MNAIATAHTQTPSSIRIVMHKDIIDVLLMWLPSGKTQTPITLQIVVVHKRSVCTHMNPLCESTYTQFTHNSC